jgi:hypothetical protein
MSLKKAIIGETLKFEAKFRNKLLSVGWLKLAKKHIVRVVLSKQQKELLDRICFKLGQSESETMRVAFLQYAEKLNLVSEKVHG